MKWLRRLDTILGKAESWVLVLFLAVMVLLGFAQVILRNFFNTGLLWADTVVRHLVLWAGFMGAALAASEDRHIGMDAITKFIPPRGRAGARVATFLFAAAVCWFLGDAGLRFLLDEKEAGSEIVLSVPTWIGLLVVPIGYWLLSLHFVVKVAENIVVAFGKGGEAIS
jgi:TRAP-type C4-dicarboxylate transport system permease small subunit